MGDDGCVMWAEKCGMREAAALAGAAGRARLAPAHRHSAGAAMGAGSGGTGPHQPPGETTENITHGSEVQRFTPSFSRRLPSTAASVQAWAKT